MNQKRKMKKSVEIMHSIKKSRRRAGDLKSKKWKICENKYPRNLKSGKVREIKFSRNFTNIQIYIHCNTLASKKSRTLNFHTHK